MKKNAIVVFKRIVITLIAVLSLHTLSGCYYSTYMQEYADESVYYVQHVLTEEQMRWILFWEILLVILLIVVIALSIVLFIRYRKTEKRAIQESVRASTLKKENEALGRLSTMKTIFFQDMSHDFKTPLTVISTSVLNAMDVLDYEMDKDELRESLTIAQSEVMRLSRIVDNALTHAAVHDNHYDKVSIDLSQLLHRVSETYTAFLERRENSLTISISEELPRVYGNADTLFNVFSNLIANSNQHTKNGEVTVHARAEQEAAERADDKRFVVVTVSDNGTGIKSEILANIFERGVTEAGTGLGLPICKTAIEEHGGTIMVESEEGKGTSVTLTIPICSQ
ncbi:MAG: HAMP domain-containing histidine kinase [Oscillospiraceae bacterium]|nr:HAMP domain-containing histidine kinase [Oscillospiraceae bacterium]